MQHMRRMCLIAAAFFLSASQARIEAQSITPIANQNANQVEQLRFPTQYTITGVPLGYNSVV